MRTTSHAGRTAARTGLQHTTVVWYGGSCTNKHNKLTDTSIQVLCNVYSVSFTNVLY